jgi:hypothetical protein
VIPALAMFDAVKDKIGEMLGAAQQAFGQLKSTILDCVAAFRPFQVELFTRAVRDLQAVFGQMFLPVLQEATRYVRMVSDYFYSLPASFKSLITQAAKIVLVVGGIAAVVGALVSAAALIAPFVSGVGAVITAFGVMTYAMSRTASGAQLFRDLLGGGEQVLAGIINTVKSVWAQLAPLRAALDSQLSALAESLQKLWAAVKPVAVVLVGATVKIALELVIKTMTWFARQLTSLADWITREVRKLGIDLQLPDVSRPKKDSFGLGTHGATITSDVAGFKAKIEEEIIANTGGDIQKDIAENTKETAELQRKTNEKLEEIEAGMRQGWKSGLPSEFYKSPDFWRGVTGGLFGP